MENDLEERKAQEVAKLLDTGYFTCNATITRGGKLHRKPLRKHLQLKVTPVLVQVPLELVD